MAVTQTACQASLQTSAEFKRSFQSLLFQGIEGLKNSFSPAQEEKRTATLKQASGIAPAFFLLCFLFNLFLFLFNFNFIFYLFFSLNNSNKRQTLRPLTCPDRTSTKFHPPGPNLPPPPPKPTCWSLLQVHKRAKAAYFVCQNVLTFTLKSPSVLIAL